MNCFSSSSCHRNSSNKELPKRYGSIEAIKPLLIKVEPCSSKYLQPKSQQNSPNNKSCENNRPFSVLFHTQNTGKLINQSFDNRYLVAKNHLQNQESFMFQQRRSPQFSKNTVRKVPMHEKRLKTEQPQPLSFPDNGIKIKQKISESKYLLNLKLGFPPKLNSSKKSKKKTESNNSSFMSEGDKNILLESLGEKTIEKKSSQRTSLMVSPPKQRVKIHSLTKMGNEEKKMKVPTFIKEKQQARSRKSSIQKNHNKNSAEKMTSSEQICKFFNQQMQTEYQIKINIKPALKKRIIEDFQLIKQLGEGAFAKAFMAIQKNTNFLCVLKAIDKQKLTQPQINNLIRQIKTQSLLNHPHLAGFYGFFDDETNIYLIIQLLPSGDLKATVGNRCYPQTKTADIIRQVCKGINHMHEFSIIHRDIKPQNIFMFENYVKLGDFGCAVYCDDRRKSFVGSPFYLSPQQLHSQAYDHKVDVWQIGVLAYQLLYKNCPFEKDIIGIMQGINEKKQLSDLLFPQKNNVSEQAKDFLQRCLNKNPNQRINLIQALSHNFLKKTQKEISLKL